MDCNLRSPKTESQRKDMPSGPRAGPPSQSWVCPMPSGAPGAQKEQLSKAGLCLLPSLREGSCV